MRGIPTSHSSLSTIPFFSHFREVRMQRAETILCFLSSMSNCITFLSFFLWKKDSEFCLMWSCYYNVHKNTVSSAACATINIVTVNKYHKLCAAILLLLAGIVCVCALIRLFFSFKILNRPSFLLWVVHIILSLCPGVTVRAKESCPTKSVEPSALLEHSSRVRSAQTTTSGILYFSALLLELHTCEKRPFQPYIITRKGAKRFLLLQLMISHWWFQLTVSSLA